MPARSRAPFGGMVRRNDMSNRVLRLGGVEDVMVVVWRVVGRSRSNSGSARPERNDTRSYAHGPDWRPCMACTRTWLLALVLAAGASAQVAPTPVLTADTLFPAVGAVVTPSLSGPAGGTFFFLASLLPAVVPLGAKGTLFLDPAAFFVIFSGTLPAGGSVSLPLAIPALTEADGVFFYLQGAVKLAGKTGLSNALPFRIGLEPPAGARHPVALPARPDGARAFLAHQEDGPGSGIDAAADQPLLPLPGGGEAVGVG